MGLAIHGYMVAAAFLGDHRVQFAGRYQSSRMLRCVGPQHVLRQLDGLGDPARQVVEQLADVELGIVIGVGNPNRSPRLSSSPRR